MFTLPGLSALILFLYLRPQEFIPILQRLPLLYIFFGAAVGGLLVDLKLRLLKPLPAPILLNAVLCFGWILIVIGVKVPAAAKMGNIISFTIVFATFFVICQGVQGFRALRWFAAIIIFCNLFLTFVGIHQAYAPYECLEIEHAMQRIGVSDGRSCETVVDCRGIEAEPGAAYDCQRVGLFGTTALNDRVRYRGELQDPNEMATTMSSSIALMIALTMRRRKGYHMALLVVTTITIFICVIFTQSRGGMLAFMSVIGVYFIRRYGFRYAILGVVAMLPLMAMGGRGGSAAEASTHGRYEAWRAGFQMFTSDPIFGVGKGMFTNYHNLTAHNSYVLAFAELGYIGMVLWISVIYMALKPAVVAIIDFADDPNAAQARNWGIAIIAMFAPFLLQMLFLTLNYHTMLWVVCGIAGAYQNSVKRHVPGWKVKFGLIDVAAIAIGCAGFIVVLPIFLSLKGF